MGDFALASSGWPTVEVRRAAARLYERRRNQQTWLTFYPAAGAGALDKRFRTLENIAENRLGPGASARNPEPRTSVELITYVRAGRIRRTDSTGRERIIHAGEFERIAAGPGDRCVETNASPTHFAHVFRISLRRPEPQVELNREQRHFSEAERRGRMFVVASRDGRRGSLRIAQDALIFSTLLYPGQRLVHELLPGRCAWLHVVHGELSLGELVLAKGDGAGLTCEALSATAREHSEILVVDHSIKIDCVSERL